MKPTIALFLFCYSLFFGANAQNRSADTVLSAISNLVQNYKKERGDNLLLYNGVEYARSYPHTTGSPYLISDTFRLGSLVYDGVAYQNVLLNYDVTSACVVIKNKNNFLIELIPEKLNSFILNQHIFVSLSASNVPKDVMMPGIYEWYDHNTVGVFIRHRKGVVRTSNPADLDHFKEYNEIFIQNGSEVSRIKNNKDLLAAFPDQKNAINSYLRQNHLSYKENAEETAVKVTAYYAQLKTR